ncbi:hypothetical protein D3C83_128040 [compost metagenome]
MRSLQRIPPRATLAPRRWTPSMRDDRTHTSYRSRLFDTADSDSHANLNDV